MQNGNTCFAGNSFGKHGKRNDKECNKNCQHNKDFKCGAGWRNSVYRVGEDDRKDTGKEGGL
jgi:hypothetical protein